MFGREYLEIWLMRFLLQNQGAETSIMSESQVTKLLKTSVLLPKFIFEDNIIA